jgi:hypothetical protein
VSDLTHSVDLERGGFWRRALALLIDALVTTLILQLLAFALFPLSNGRVQSTGGLVLLYCDTLAAVPEGVSVPADFAATSIKDCRSGIFGLTSARMVRVTRFTQNGLIATTREITHLLDAEGKPFTGPTLDFLRLPLLFAMRFLFDCGGGTPGRRVCRLRLSAATDGPIPPPVSAAGRRYAAQVLPVAPLVVWSALQWRLVDAAPADSLWLALLLVIPGVAVLIGVPISAYAIIYRRDAWYDRFGATRVLRLDRNKAVIPIAAAAPPLIPTDGDLAYPQALSEQADGDAPAIDHAPPPLPQALPPPLPRPASKNYLARHWRGELSLPKSYWVNGLVGGFAVGFTIGALAYAINRQGEVQPILWMASLILTWAVVALFTIWQAVGVWRSATHYRQSGRTFWGGAAKVATVLGLLNAGYNFLVFGTAQLAGIYEIVTGDSRVGPHRFQVLANGQILEFSGGITFGVAGELEEFLNAMGNVKAVRLNSIGGRILEAQKMSDMIRSRGLSTYVTQDCMSACTIVFLGGKERFIAPSARLGFHQPAFRGMTAADRNAAISNEEARLQRLGLSKDFAIRANAASPDGMWYPDKDELLREKVATRIVIPQALQPEPAKPPAANAAPPARADLAQPTAPAPIAAPLVLPAPGAPLQTEVGTFDTGRARIPADLMKRLSTPPKKAAVLPPSAGTGRAAATGEQK